MVEQIETPTGEKYAARYTQTETNYTPDYVGEGGHCAGCRWFIAHSEYGEGCTIVESYPADILPTGRCDRHEAMPPVEPYVQQVEIVEGVAEVGKASTTTTDGNVDTLPIPQVDKQTSWLAHAKATLADALRGKADVQPTAFKVIGNHWFARWSNTFKDRDNEYFSTKAHDEYITRLQMGVIPMPELWVNHIAGSKHGTAKVVSRIGHFMIAAGDFDDTPMGKAAERYYKKHKVDGVSHGFAFDKQQLIDGVYHQYNTFEISPLMRKIPANPFTTFDEVQGMKITDADAQVLKEMFGDEFVEHEIIAKTEQASKIMIEAGHAFKDFVEAPPATKEVSECMQGYMDDGMSEADAKTKCEETKTARGDKALAGLVIDILKDHAGVVTLVDAMGKSIKSHDDATTALIEGFKTDLVALKAQLDGRSRIASKDDDTVVDKSKVDSDIVTDMEKTKADPFWNPAG